MIAIATIYLFLLIFRPFEYWPALQGLYIERIFLIAFAGAVVFTKRKKWHSSPINMSVVMMLLACGVATAVSDDPAGSYILLYEFIKMCLLYALFQAVLVTKNDVVFLVLGYLSVMAIYVGKSAWEFFFNGRHVYRMGIRRMVGVDLTLGDPNGFAASIAYSLPLAVMALRIPTLSRRIKCGVLAYVALALIAVVFTGSRSGQLTCLLFVVMLLAVSPRKYLYLPLTGLLLALAWAAMPLEYQERFQSAYDQDVGPANAAESANSRIVLFETALSIFSEHPVAGVGPGMFSLHNEFGLSPHSLYGQILSETGLVGSASFVLFLVLLFRALWDNAQAKVFPVETMKTSRLIGIACLQVLLLLLFNGIVSHNFYRFQWLFVAAIVVSICKKIEFRMRGNGKG